MTKYLNRLTSLFHLHLPCAIRSLQTNQILPGFLFMRRAFPNVRSLAVFMAMFESRSLRVYVLGVCVRRTPLSLCQSLLPVSQTPPLISDWLRLLLRLSLGSSSLSLGSA